MAAAFGTPYSQRDSRKTVSFRNDNLSNLPDHFVLDNTDIDGYYYLCGAWVSFTCFCSRNLIVKKNGGVWCAEAENFLLAHAPRL